MLLSGPPMNEGRWPGPRSVLTPEAIAAWTSSGRRKSSSRGSQPPPPIVEPTFTSLASHPAWGRFRTLLVRALDPFPDACRAIEHALDNADDAAPPLPPIT